MDCAPEDIITFRAGIPPFGESRRFVLISEEKKQPLVFLQSADEESLCFITLPVRAVDAKYQLAVEPQDLALIDWAEERPPAIDDVLCLAILTIPEAGPVTANLLAPVLIRSSARLGVQAVRADSVYTHLYVLDQPASAGGGAC